MENLEAAQGFAAAGKAAYVEIPAAKIRHFWDSLFPALSKNEIADCLAGANHRWKAGHDLILDVSKTWKDKGIKEAAKQAGHIIFTDFTTKAGIPIPLLSQSGLGKWLVELGISPKWMCLNIMDSAVGVLCVADGCFDVVAAFSGNMQMNFETFCKTFGAGAVELVGGFATENPLLVISGGEHITAGIVSAWKTYTLQIDLVPFFGATLTSTLLGFLTSRYLCKNEMPEAIQKSVKSGMITGLFQLSASFGYGAAVCCAYIDYVKYLAQRDSKEVAKVMKVDKNYYDNFLQILNSFEDKKFRDNYVKFNNQIIDKLASSGGYERLIGKRRLDIAMSVLNSNRDSEIKKLMQGDFLVNYLEKF